MFVGHAVLAFAAGTVLAARKRSEGRALAVGVAAGLFAAVPDVDMAYALVGVLSAAGGDVWAVTGAFWGASAVVHRAVTHSLVLGVPAAVAFALAPSRPRAAGGLLAVLAAGVLVVSGPVAAAVLALFAAAGSAVAAGASLVGLSRRERLGAALLGLLSHPFGDLLTGEPPAMLYPLDATLVAARVSPFADATLNLLFAFGVELAVLWLGVVVFARYTGRRVAPAVDARAALGAGYALAVFVVPPPTFTVSYQFVFGAVAVGAVGASPVALLRRDLRTAVTSFPAVVTGLAGVTAAVAAYAAAYLLL